MTASYSYERITLAASTIQFLQGVKALLSTRLTKTTFLEQEIVLTATVSMY